jgi:hypothetical protein
MRLHLLHRRPRVPTMKLNFGQQSRIRAKEPLQEAPPRVQEPPLNHRRPRRDDTPAEATSSRTKGAGTGGSGALVRTAELTSAKFKVRRSDFGGAKHLGSNFSPSLEWPRFERGPNRGRMVPCNCAGRLSGWITTEYLTEAPPADAKDAPGDAAGNTGRGLRPTPQ